MASQILAIVEKVQVVAEGIQPPLRLLSQQSWHPSRVRQWLQDFFLLGSARQQQAPDQNEQVPFLGRSAPLPLVAIRGVFQRMEGPQSRNYFAEDLEQ